MLPEPLSINLATMEIMESSLSDAQRLKSLWIIYCSQRRIYLLWGSHMLCAHASSLPQ